MNGSAPEPFVARFSVAKLLAWAIPSGGMAALCLPFAIGGLASGTMAGIVLGLAGAIGLLFFGVIAAVQTVRLFDRRAQATRDGMEPLCIEGFAQGLGPQACKQRMLRGVTPTTSASSPAVIQSASRTSSESTRSCRALLIRQVNHGPWPRFPPPRKGVWLSPSSAFTTMAEEEADR